VRVLVHSLLAVGLLTATAEAKQRQVPRHPIDAATYDVLLADVIAEPFADGKMQPIHAARAANCTFTAAQVVTLLAAFEFWVERVDALPELPLAKGDRAGANAVLRYFSGAPATMQSEAQRILAVD
jgi:hypothetical protein